MSDIEKFVALYKSVGIELTPIHQNDGEKNILVLRLEARVTPKVTGYSLFYTELVFDNAGQFIQQCVYE